MVFSFFKKKDETPPPKAPASSARSSAPPPKPADSPVNPTGDQAAREGADESTSTSAAERGPDSLGDFNLQHESSHIEVDEFNDEISAAIEQAAILYANDQVMAAIGALAECIDDGHAGHNSPDTWLMLLELYQIQNMREAYHDLALKYVVKFERTAPVWVEGGITSKPAPKAGDKKPGSGGYLGMTGELSASRPAPFEQLQKAIDKGDPLRLDFGKTQDIDASGAAELLRLLQLCKKKKFKPQLLGMSHLASLLTPKVEVMRNNPDEMPFWVLLLETKQQAGLLEEFENLAVDYAVTFEVSPPSWDAGATLKTAAQVSAEEAKQRAEVEAELGEDAEPDDVCKLTGTILNANEVTFNQVLQYAATHQEVILDLSELKRLDFESAGVMLNLMIGLTSQGKTITLRRANEMVLALLRIMGITELAQVVRKKH